jgi:hypothetical protein
MRQLYLFYLQGEIYSLEQLLSEEKNESLESVGDALQETMADPILQLPAIINSIRDTEYESSYVYLVDTEDTDNADNLENANESLEGGDLK